MFGYCPQCDKRMGAHKCAGVVQEWTKPQSVLKIIPVDMDISIVPHITMGEVCGHTVSLKEWKKHNTARSSAVPNAIPAAA